MKDYRYYSKIIDEIEKVRKKNNKNWMDLLRIAFKYAPKETTKVFSQIYKEDRKLNNLARNEEGLKKTLEQMEQRDEVMLKYFQ